MANKALTATVRLNTVQFERKLKVITQSIDALNKKVNIQANHHNKVNIKLNQTVKIVNNVKTQTDNWKKSQDKVNASIRSGGSLLGTMLGKVRRLASTYLGVMGAKAVFNTTDTLIGAQNKLNYVNAQSLGASGTNSDGTYSNKTLDLTQQSLDKIYASAQKVRTSYTDMMGNVSKTMTLAGGAFNNNIDNAIRFQEIMAEAYAVGGASAEEMSTSMYQLTQALGSGTLAGDELRSVREGAPLAYQAIENFAQGIYGTTDSLKDMASQGKITSDIVVAAIMDEGAALDNAFAQTKQTFGQTFDQIKSAAVYAFQPVMDVLSNLLTTANNNGLIQSFEKMFLGIAKIIMIIVTLVSNVVSAIAEHWYWIQYVVYGILTFILAMIIKASAIIVGKALLWALSIIAANLPLFTTIMLISMIIALIVEATGSFENACGVIVGAIFGAISVIWNALVTLLTYTIQFLITPLVTQWTNFANFFGNLFNDPISAIIYSFETLAQSVLGILETIAKGIDAIFGSNLAEAVSGWSDKLSGKADFLANKYGNGSYEQKSDLLNQTNDMLHGIQGKLTWDTSNAYNTGNSLGKAGVQWAKGGIDRIGDKLGLNLSGLATDFPSGGASGYDDAEKLLGNIDNNTGSMADSMSSTSEDLSYLRRVADMEWKKEYTTATINLKMDNNIQSEADYEGFVTRLRDDMYEEMIRLADGAYVY